LDIAVVHKVLSFMAGHELAPARSISQQFHDVSRSQRLWRALCERAVAAAANPFQLDALSLRDAQYKYNRFVGPNSNPDSKADAGRQSPASPVRRVGGGGGGDGQSPSSRNRSQKGRAGSAESKRRAGDDAGSFDLGVAAIDSDASDGRDWRGLYRSIVTDVVTRRRSAHGERTLLDARFASTCDMFTHVRLCISQRVSRGSGFKRTFVSIEAGSSTLVAAVNMFALAQPSDLPH
jgi:hypothetical protein